MMQIAARAVTSPENEFYMIVYEFKSEDGVLGYAGLSDGKNLPSAWGPWKFMRAIEIDRGANSRNDEIYGGVGERGFWVDFPKLPYDSERMVGAQYDNVLVVKTAKKKHKKSGVSIAQNPPARKTNLRSVLRV